MTIKQGLVCALVGCLAFDLVPARAWAAEAHAPADLAAAAPAPSAPDAIDFHAAVRDAIARLDAPDASASPHPIASASPSTSRAAARAAVRLPGGGKSGLIIGLVTTVVSVGVTLYMIKQMQKNNDDAKDQ
jgi:hypothetical protein